MVCAVYSVLCCVVCCLVVGCHWVVIVLSWCCHCVVMVLTWCGYGHAYCDQCVSPGLAFEPTKATAHPSGTRIAIRSNQPKQQNRQLTRVLRSPLNAEVAFEPPNKANYPTLATRIAIRSNHPRQLNRQLPRVLHSLFNAGSRSNQPRTQRILHLPRVLRSVRSNRGNSTANCHACCVHSLTRGSRSNQPTTQLILHWPRVLRSVRTNRSK